MWGWITSIAAGAAEAVLALTFFQALFLALIILGFILLALYFMH